MNKNLKKAAEIALGVIALMICGVLIGLVLIGGTVVLAAPASCSTDTECMVMFGGDGSPEPVKIEDPGCAGLDCTSFAEPAGGGFLQCPEPDISEPVVAPSGALVKFT